MMRRKRGSRPNRPSRLVRQAIREAPILEAQRWYGRGPTGPDGSRLPLSSAAIREKLADGMTRWERTVIVNTVPVTERKRGPVPKQSWEASEQYKKYSI